MSPLGYLGRLISRADVRFSASTTAGPAWSIAARACVCVHSTAFCAPRDDRVSLLESRPLQPWPHQLYDISEICDLAPRGTLRHVDIHALAITRTLSNAPGDATDGHDVGLNAMYVATVHVEQPNLYG